jgi:hypothetical protein
MRGDRVTERTPLPIVHQPFMTVIPNRSPYQKAHVQRAHAHNALTQHLRPYWRSQPGARQDAALYQWHEGEWALLWSCKRGDDITGQPWKEATL